MTGIKNSPIPRRNEEIIAREVEREIYLCSPEGDQMHMLTDVAADLWRACDGQRSLGEITEWLLSRYDVDRATLTRDLDVCLKDMQTRKLIDLH